MKLAKITPECVEYLEGVVGVVEANSFERHSLWRENEDGLKLSWVSSRMGFIPLVGYFQRNQVRISLFTDVVDGHKLLFYYATSQVVDYRMIDAWLKANLPKTAFRRDGYVNHVDAMNFHNVFHEMKYRAAA